MDAAQVKHQGILTKRGRMIKSWLQRWFVLTPSKLLYFESKASVLDSSPGNAAVAMRVGYARLAGLCCVHVVMCFRW